MALPTSGALSLNQIHVEAGGTTGTTCSLNDSDIRGLTAASGRTINSTLGTNIDFADFYGASAPVSTPASFGKTGVTPGTYTLFTTTQFIYWNEKYRGTTTMTNDVNVEFNETSDFLDSSNNTQTIVSISHNNNKSPNPANFVVTLLGHNVSTSSWTLSYAGLSITGNSGFTTSGGVSYSSPTTTNFSATGSNGTSYNLTQFKYDRTTVPIFTNGLPTSSNQSWTIT